MSAAGGPAPRIAICDYGVGNLRSVERALEAAGAEVELTGSAERVTASDGVVLPGVGAFAPAARALEESGLGPAIHAMARFRRPVLGVCLGFQLLFDRSEEGEGGRGLGLLRGTVRRIHPQPPLKVPHMGWNRLRIVRPSPLLDGVEDGAYVYFVHSYAADADDGDIVATTDHGEEIVAAVQRTTVMGTQFHPEKSGAAGLRIYANFVRACAGARDRADTPVPLSADAAPEAPR